MDNVFKVKTISVQYGDAQIKCHKIKVIKEDNSNRGPGFHSHKYYECHFLEKGMAKFLIDNHSIELKPMQMLIIPPDRSHLSLSLDSSCVNHVFSFSLHYIESNDKGIFDDFQMLLEKASISPVKVSEKLVSFVKEFRSIPVGDSIADYCFDVAKVTNIMAYLFKELNIYNTVKKMSYETTDLQALLDVYISMPENTLDDLAQATSYSKRHISRIVHSLYGMSLTDLRNQGRIQTAKELLKNTEYTIDQIALDSGFKNTNAFRESFKKYENTTPSEYRKREWKI